MCGLFDEFGNNPLSRHRRDAAFFGIGRLEQGHSHRQILPRMGRRQIRQIDIREVIGIDHQHVALRPVPVGMHRPGRAQKRGLMGFDQLHPAARIHLGDIILHLICVMMCVQKRLLNSGPFKRFDPIVKHALARDLDEAFGPCLGQGPQTCAQPSGQ